MALTSVTEGRTEASAQILFYHHVFLSTHQIEFER